MSIRAIVLGILALCGVVAANIVGAAHMTGMDCNPWFTFGVLLLSNGSAAGLVSGAVYVWLTRGKHGIG